MRHTAPLSTSLSYAPHQDVPTAAGDLAWSWAISPLNQEQMAQTVADLLGAAIRGWLGIGLARAPEELVMGTGIVTSFADLAAGRIDPAPDASVNFRSTLPTMAIAWHQLETFGRYGWTLDLLPRPRVLTVVQDGLSIELETSECRNLANGMVFHQRHAGSPEEREAWRRAIGDGEPAKRRRH